MITLTYHVTHDYYNRALDEYEDYGYDFEYEVDEKEVLPLIAVLFAKKYFKDEYKANPDKITEHLKDFIEDTEILDSIWDYFEDEVKDFFANDAYGSQRS